MEKSNLAMSIRENQGTQNYLKKIKNEIKNGSWQINKKFMDC